MSSTQDVMEDEWSLAHYGVKGMHWGVRKGESGRISAEPKLPKHPDALNAQAHKQAVRANKSTDVLSNKQMQEYITRANLEQQYSRLSAKPQHAGKAFAKNLLKQHGKKQIALLVKKGSYQALGKLLTMGM